MAIAKIKGGTRGMRGAALAKLFARMTGPVMVRQHRKHGDTFRGDAVLYLTTVGARTGKQRHNPVGYELDDDGAWLVVASFGGAAQHPGWYHNIVAHPDDVSVEVGGQHYRVRPEQLDGPRRDAAWAQIVASRPSMAEYQVKTDRVLPVLRLVRAG
jgi:deazaflavin-dependent oxidoreductase (nitroreductase family)